MPSINSMWLNDNRPVADSLLERCGFRLDGTRPNSRALERRTWFGADIQNVQAPRATRRFPALGWAISLGLANDRFGEIWRAVMGRSATADHNGVQSVGRVRPEAAIRRGKKRLL